ncbi:protein FAM110C isoform X2 [Pipistrellus kuhlii]|uniref:protein FAM110C isoform X2 n=1 Tax=Pipistrellus kuhlii TaxID=59472 RepID=UPI00174EEC52|nr:protein FAM110C isoform X2 [Pipistrellus kuhlii]
MRALPSPDAPPMERLLPGPPDAAPPARRSAVERLAADRAKYVRALPATTARGPASEGSSPAVGEGQAVDPRPPACAPGAVARRAIARKPLRPDSLVMYRQKCEFARGPGADGLQGGLAKKLLPGPRKDRTPTPPETFPAGEKGRAAGAGVTPTKPGSAAAPARPARPSVPAAPPTARPSVPAAPPAAPLTSPARPSAPAASGTRDVQAARRRGLQRSQSDLSSRYSMSAAEFDTFFQFCGLEPEVVEALGRENFSAGSDQGALRVRSVSVATSEGGFSRRSCGDEGLQEEELTEQVPSGPSVVERNARIIKWLYTCRKAAETPAPQRQGPRDLRAEAGTPRSKELY